MQINNLILAVLGFVSVRAADIPSSPSSSAASTESMPSQGISSRDQCLLGCGVGNIQCQAACDNLPNPTVEDVNKNIECVKKCNDEASITVDPAKSTACVQSCNNEFNSAGSASSAKPSGSAGSNSSNRSNASDKSASKKASVSGSKSSSGSDSSDSQTIFFSSGVAALFGMAVSQL